MLFKNTIKKAKCHASSFLTTLLHQNYSFRNTRPKSHDLLAIDFATSESYLSIYENNAPKILEFNKTRNFIPNYIAQSNEGNWVVGNSVIDKINTFKEESVLYATRRILGKKYPELRLDSTFPGLSYKVSSGRNNDAAFEINKQLYSAEFVNGLLFGHIKTAAEAINKVKYNEAVVTVPSIFDFSARNALINSAAIGGVDVIRLINQPVAAAMGYLADKNYENRTIAIYNWNGGYFDIAIAEWVSGVLDVKSVVGLAFGHSDNFNVLIQRWIQDILKKEHDIEVQPGVPGLDFHKVADQVLKEIGKHEVLELKVPYQGKEYHMRFLRAKFEELTNRIYSSTLEPCKRCLAESGFKAEEIDEVILLGKMVNMRSVHSIIETVFHKKAITPDNSELLMAKGAAMEAGILTEKVKGKLILDVNPSTISIEATGNNPAPVIFRNTVVPAQKDLYINEIKPGSKVELTVYEGENPDIQKNKVVGKFDVINPDDVNMVELDFVMDSNGLIQVNPKEESLKRNIQIKEKLIGGLSDQEVAELRKSLSL